MESTGKNDQGKWKRVPKRQKQALLMLIVCTVLFVLYACGVVLLLWYDRSMNVRQPVGETPPADSGSVSDTSLPREEEPPRREFAGGILPAGRDGGEEYLAQTLFLGDSNMVRLYAYGLVPLSNVMAMEGLGVESVTDFGCVYFAEDSTVYTMAQAVAIAKPRRIVLTFGTNDIGEYTCEAFIENYREAITALHRAYGDCDIILNSIPPVCEYSDYPQMDMETVRVFNRALLALAQELKLPYLNSIEALTDEDGFAKEEYWDADGLHMQKEALELFLRYVRTHPYETEDRRDEKALSDLPERRIPPSWQSFAR